MTATADRHLLFGLLALQNGLIDQGALVAAFQAWTRDKTRSLADHLESRGELTAASASSAGRFGPVKSPRAWRWSARLRDLSRVQAWKAARRAPWSIRPF